MTNVSEKTAENRRKWTDTRGIARHTGLSTFWFERDRCNRLVGVPYVRVGRAIRYDIDAVDKFFTGHTVQSSKDQASGV